MGLVSNNNPHRRRDGYTRSVSTASSQYVDQTKGMAVPCEQVQILSDAIACVANNTVQYETRNGTENAARGVSLCGFESHRKYFLNYR
jgi:hypothetical protein